MAIHKLIQAAKEAEALQQYDESIDLYKQVLAIDPINEWAFDRLMVIYRRQKMYTNEIETLNTAINTFGNHYQSKKSQSAKVAEVSNKLSKSLGLSDKKGNEIYIPEPINRWKKRLLTAEKKLLKMQSKL